MAKVEGMKTPGHKYNPNLNLTTNTVLTARIHKESEKAKDKRMDKIVINKSVPAPGEYNTYDAWKKS
jgi:hypothetical protein